MKEDILNYLAKTKSKNIHSKGQLASDILLNNLKCEPNEDILEIGFGTGTTIVNFASYYKNSSFTGIETNPMMFKCAQKRLYFCFQKRVNLIFNANPTILPFSNFSFDRVYIESVLAIQEGENLSKMLSEIHRVLKPNGTLIFNEGIWINSTTKERINEVNNFCQSHFGIIQANANYPYTSDWERLLVKIGFQVEFIKDIDEFEINYTDKLRHGNVLSNVFSFYGKIQSKINPKLVRSYLKFKNEMKIVAEGEKYMNGYIIKCKANR